LKLIQRKLPASSTSRAAAALPMQMINEKAVAFQSDGAKLRILRLFHSVL